MLHSWRAIVYGLAFLLIGLSAAAFAQEKAPSGDFPIALLRMEKVFDTKRLGDRLTPFKTRANELQQQAQLKQAEIENLQVKLKSMQGNNPEFAKLSVQHAKLVTELQLWANREKQELEQNEAKIYLELYRELEIVLRDYCKQKGIKLVLKHRELATDDQPYPAVVQSLGREVVFGEGLDITDEVIELLEKHLQKKAAASP